MTMQPESKTWRFVNAAHGVLQQCVRAADDEDLDSLVGHQLREAGMYIAAALATLELRQPTDVEQLLGGPLIGVPLTLNEVDQLIAIVTGARDRVEPMSQFLFDQMSVLRDKLIAADQETRTLYGLPLD